MKLSVFFQTLLEAGRVQVLAPPSPIRSEDQEATLELLGRFYIGDSVEMAYRPPDFCPPAALWAAEYFYRAVHLTVLRDLDETAIRKWLRPYPADTDPEVVYSVDLAFRYLPGLFGLAKGLAPRDLLVEMLRETAVEWGFSTVGMDLNAEPDLTHILAHPALRAAYVDRIIRHKDAKRAADPRVAPLVREAMGGFAESIWPGWSQGKW
jgi:hypothetical protein